MNDKPSKIAPAFDILSRLQKLQNRKELAQKLVTAKCEMFSFHMANDNSTPEEIAKSRDEYMSAFEAYVDLCIELRPEALQLSKDAEDLKAS